MAENKAIPLRLRPITKKYLEELVRAGAYGKDRSAVMRRFIEAGIVAALQGGVIEKRDIEAFGENLAKAVTDESSDDDED